MGMEGKCCPFCGGSFEQVDDGLWACMDCNEEFTLGEDGKLYHESGDFSSGPCELEELSDGLVHAIAKFMRDE